jgi:hypothetical protein
MRAIVAGTVGYWKSCKNKKRVVDCASSDLEATTEGIAQQESELARV